MRFMCSLIPSACCITSADSLPFSVVDKKSRIPFAFFCVFADVLYISRSQKQNFVCVCVCVGVVFYQVRKHW